MSFYSISYAPVPLALCPQNVLRKHLFQGRPLQVLLTPGDLGQLFVLSEMIYKAVCKIFFTEDRLAPHPGPDRLFADPTFDELPVFLLRLAPLSTKLAQYAITMLTGYRIFPSSALKALSCMYLLKEGSTFGSGKSSP